MNENLITVLANAYEKDCIARAVPPEYGCFLVFCKTYLQSNPPVTVTYPLSGIGLCLQDGTIVRLTDKEDQPFMRDDSIPITRLSLREPRTPDNSLPVFGKVP